MIRFTVHVSDVKAAARRTGKSIRAAMTRKLQVFGDTVFDEIQFSAPVATGEYLASFAMGFNPDESQPGPMGPNAYRNKKGSGYDEAQAAANREKAIRSFSARYNRAAWTYPYRNFKLVNTAPHAAAVEYGGNSPAGFGLIRMAVSSGIQAAKIAAPLKLTRMRGGNPVRLGGLDLEDEI